MPTTCPSFSALINKLEYPTVNKTPLGNNFSIKTLLESVSIETDGLIQLITGSPKNLLAPSIKSSNQTEWDSTKRIMDIMFNRLYISLEGKDDSLLTKEINQFKEKIVDRIENLIDNLIFTAGQIYLLKEYYQGFDVDELIDNIERLGQYSETIQDLNKNKLPLVDSFFDDVHNYLDFLLNKQEKGLATPNGESMAILKKISIDKWTYELCWIADNKFISYDVKPFKATISNVQKFNEGCKILAERLEIYIRTGNKNQVPTNPPAFGDLTAY